MPGASSHSHARPVAGLVTVAASTSIAGDQENGPALASTGRAAAPSARASHSVPLGLPTTGNGDADATRKASQRPSRDQAAATAPAGAATACRAAGRPGTNPSSTYSRPDDTNASRPWPEKAAAPTAGRGACRDPGPPGRPAAAGLEQVPPAGAPDTGAREAAPWEARAGEDAAA
jgi:hypothetical protein